MLGLGCATVENASPTVLRVGISADYPPLIFKENGQIKGLEADLARRLARELGREVRFIEIPWKDQIDALEKGRTDIIMSALSITPMRAARLHFAEPYLGIGQMALVRRAEANRFANPLLLVNTTARVGVTEGTTGDLLVQEKMRRAERVVIADNAAAIRALQRNRIDVYIADAPTIWWLASRYEGEGLKGLFEPLTREQLAWGIARDNPELLGQVNALLEIWKSDGSLDRTMAPWIP